jgi:hypothetical protein
MPVFFNRSPQSFSLATAAPRCHRPRHCWSPLVFPAPLLMVLQAVGVLLPATTHTSSPILLLLHCPFVQGPPTAPPTLSSSVLLLHRQPPAPPLLGQHGSDMVSMAREPPRAAPSFSKAWAEPIFSVRSLSELDRAELKNSELRHRSD